VYGIGKLAGEAPVVCGDGEQALDYVYVDDDVEAMLAAMTKDVSGATLNVGSRVAVSVKIYRLALMAAAGRRQPR
jgi:nucleoside-diphosphate-sugar epimerase